MIKAVKRLRSIRLPAYLKARNLKIGLVIGALWGLLSTVAFVTVGMFGDESHSYHWLFRIFRDSVYTLWFKTLFLPFLLSLEAGFAFAFFGSTPVGAAIGAAVGAVVSVINYVIRKTR
ncbi:hypothetical protein KAI30_00920 [Candidatus Bathyarchaeota archaeon]|nr:hypothetical protein [Candidatus Bathyarchaeota archaeon]